MGDEKDVDIGRAKVLRHNVLVTRENLGRQAAEHDQEDVLVTECMQ